MAALPEYVSFEEQGFGEKLDYQVRQSQMDRGAAKQRPGISKALRARKGRLNIGSNTNKLAFEDWLKTINNGTGWFDYADPMKIITPDPFNYVEPPPGHNVVKARFINTTWEFELLNGAFWVAQCEMESIG